jgi:hypothetical protein
MFKFVLFSFLFVILIRSFSYWLSVNFAIMISISSSVFFRSWTISVCNEDVAYLLVGNM